MPKTLEHIFDGFALTADFYPCPTPTQKPLLFCLPGGGGSKGFFDLAPGFSFVSRMTRLGYDLITMDHPGTASNPLPLTHPFLTPHQSASYMLDCLKAWRGDRTIIGIGHSMGGMMVTLMQSLGKPFDSLVLLGSNAGGLDWGLSEDEKAYINKPAEFARDLEKLTLNRFQTEFSMAGPGPSGESITFGGETPELVDCLKQISCELFSAGGMMSMTRGSFRADVEAIDVPILFISGDHDIGIPIEEAPKDYINAPKTDIFVLEKTGHNSMAFSSIAALCQRVDQWVEALQ